MVRAVAHHHVAGAVLRERYLRPLGVSGCAVPGEARQLLLRVLGLRHRRAFGLGFSDISLSFNSTVADCRPP